MSKRLITQPWLISICMLLPAALPVVLLAALWLAVPWQWVWHSVCGLGLALCGLAAFKRRAWAAFYALVSAAYVAAAMFALGLLADAPHRPDVDGQTPIGAPSWLAWTLGLLLAVTLMCSLVGLCGLAWRAMRLNRPLALRPRQLLGGTVLTLVSTILFCMMMLIGARYAGMQTNLQLVQLLADGGLQVFTPVRYAREVLATSYYWRDDAATPKLESFSGIPTSGYLGGADAAHAYIRSHANSADPWSGADSYDTAFDADERTEQSDTWGLRFEKIPFAPTLNRTNSPLADMRGVDPENRVRYTGVISNVAPGSAAALVGVQRGDTLFSVNGEPYFELVSRLVQTAGAKPMKGIVKTTLEPAAKDTSIKKKLVVNTADGKTITVTGRKPYKTTGIQSVAWYTLGGTQVAPGFRSEVLYLRADAFTPHLAVQAEADIRKSAQAAAQQAPISAVSDAAMWPDAVLNAGVTTLILDFRVNGGGRAKAAGELADRLLGKYLQPGLGLPAEQHLDNGEVIQKPTVWFKKPDPAEMPRRQTNGKPYEQTGLLRGIKTVLVLASRDTCSASELLIHGLQKHLEGKVRFAVIGDTTCGKPHGYTNRDYFGTSVWVVDSAWVNAHGKPAYPTGIAPTCPVKDLLLGPEGAWDDLVFQAALNYAWHGRCD